MSTGFLIVNRINHHKSLTQYTYVHTHLVFPYGIQNFDIVIALQMVLIGCSFSYIRLWNIHICKTFFEMAIKMLRAVMRSGVILPNVEGTIVDITSRFPFKIKELEES